MVRRRGRRGVVVAEKLLYSRLELILSPARPAGAVPDAVDDRVRSIARDHGLEGGPARRHVLAAPAAAVEVLVTRATVEEQFAVGIYLPQRRDAVERALSPYNGYETMTARVAPRRAALLEEPRDDAAAEARSRRARLAPLSTR